MSQEMTEAQNIEYDRRKDIMWAVAPLAAHYEIEMRKQIDIRDSKIKIINSKWLLALIIIGAIIDGLVPGRDFGTLMWGISGVVIGVAMAEERFIANRILQLEIQLFSLHCQWASATGSTALGNIREFISNEYFDSEDDDYIKWMHEQLTHLLDEIKHVPFSERFDKIFAKSQ